MKAFIKNPFLTSAFVAIIFSIFIYAFHNSITMYSVIFLSYANLTFGWTYLISGFSTIPFLGSYIVQLFLINTWIFYIFPMLLITLAHSLLSEKKMDKNYIIKSSLTFALIIYFPASYPLYHSLQGIVHVVSSSIKSPMGITYMFPKIIFIILICYLSLYIFNNVFIQKDKIPKSQLVLRLVLISILIILLGPALFKTINYSQCNPGFLLVTNSIEEANNNSKLNPRPIGNGNKWGYADNNGNIVIEPQYEKTNSFSEGLAAVSIDGEQWGYINESGEMIINPIFSKASIFSDGVAAVCNKENKCGFIDKTGKVIVNLRFEEASTFNEGLAGVKINGQYGYINKIGKFIIPPKYALASSFHEGLSSVTINKQLFFINKYGQVVIKPKLDKALSFKDGTVTTYNETEWIKIDKTGRELCRGMSIYK